MRTRKEIEKDTEDVQPALGIGLLIEVMLDIREQLTQIECRLADVQNNRSQFHVAKER